ncbi:unnamed protein product [Lactuca saligna]|uniref:Cytochrome P450 n=1 Tax=Lactuca saligna TaxID=75948 RepID=A0AA35YPB8_LACSI|nr:unnamed protein product [Lactuca saligna]
MLTGNPTNVQHILKTKFSPYQRVVENRQFTTNILNEKKQALTTELVDFFSRFLNSIHLDEKHLTDIVISFILARRDTTSAALTWFFWLLYKNPTIEIEVVNEVKDKENLDSSIYDEVQDMVYTYASLCESMRLYPPVLVDTKQARANDVSPDGDRHEEKYDGSRFRGNETFVSNLISFTLDRLIPHVFHGAHHLFIKCL